MEALRRFDRELTRGEDLQFVLNYVLNWTKSRTHADYAVIARWDENRKFFEVLLADGVPLERDYHAGDTLWLPDGLTPQEEIHEDLPQANNGVLVDDSRTMMVAELRQATGNLIGVLVVQRHGAFPFDDAQIQFMRVIADRLAISMHMSMLLRKVEQFSLNRKQLFRMLSHDLRQPLTVLMGYIQLVEFSLKTGREIDLRTYLAYILTGAQDLKQLLEEVLLMERVADLSRGEWEIISMQQVCQAAIEKNHPLILLHEHDLEVNLPDDEAHCRGLRVELKEAVSNLISNAAKYTPKGGTIKVSLYAQPGRWVVEVTDNGYGIDPERQKRLFEAFFRAQQPGTEDIKGTGLGLNLVKIIVEKHDGQVFFSSEPGKGSTFGFWIPAV
jgi:signal transduction histidine kinase